MKPVLIAACITALAACSDASPFKNQPLQPSPAATPAKAPPAPAAEAPAPNADKLLAARVKLTLEREAKLQAGGIDVTAADGTVTLWGTATSVVERTRVAGLAAKVEGVKAVDNRIAVVKGS